MDFGESEELEALRDLVARFLEREVTPEIAAQWDRDDLVPRDMLKRMAEIGLTTLTVPEEYGGMGREVVSLITVIELIARRSTGLAGMLIMNTCYGSLNITESGSEKQKAELLPALCAGDILFAYGLSEPNVGADIASVETRAEIRDGRVIVNGYKRWCSGASFSDYIFLLVRSGERDARYRNLSVLLVPPDSPGITIEHISTLGAHGIPTNDVILEDVEVPLENILGGEAMWNRGWEQMAGPGLEVEKLETPALALGVAEAAVEEAWQYAQERKQFGKAICTQQSIRHTLSEVHTKLQACRLMLRNAAWKVQNGLPSAVDTSMAKLFISDNAVEIVLACQRILGAYGYAHGFAMERYVRDVLVMPIWGGSSAIQKNNIANFLKLPKA
jgi:alkylation response protein AidB-like acyl-CoA dehydrogenase